MAFRTLLETEWRNSGLNTDLWVEGYDGDDEDESGYK